MDGTYHASSSSASSSNFLSSLRLCQPSPMERRQHTKHFPMNPASFHPRYNHVFKCPILIQSVKEERDSRKANRSRIIPNPVKRACRLFTGQVRSPLTYLCLLNAPFLFTHAYALPFRPLGNLPQRRVRVFHATWRKLHLRVRSSDAAARFSS